MTTGTVATPHRDSTLRHLGTSVLVCAVTILALGVVYPLAVVGLASLAFPFRAGGSIVVDGGRPIGSALVGQLWTSPRYVHGRPSAAGKDGYDPTATGGTNLGPTSAKLLDATREAIAAERAANPDARGPVPIDLVTSSASGVDPEISPEAARFQAPRVARARGIPVATVDALIDRVTTGPTLGFLGEPRVDVFALNRALDAREKGR